MEPKVEAASSSGYSGLGIRAGLHRGAGAGFYLVDEGFLEAGLRHMRAREMV